MQIRPSANSSDKRFYDPDRDIAYLGSHLLAKAVSDLSSGSLNAWQQEVMTKFELTPEDLIEATNRFIDAFDMVLKEPAKYPDLPAAFAKSGYFDTPRAAQHLIEAKIGQYTCGAFLHGVKDITVYGEAAPISAEQLSQAAEKTVHACERSKVVRWFLRRLWLA